jgi:hypothetical protein
LDIPVHYDPILSKIIAWAPARRLAIRRMQQALSEYAVLGPRTNLPYLGAIIGHPAFAAGELSTEFLLEHLAGWHPPQPSRRRTSRCGPNGTVRLPRRRPRSFADPWERLGGALMTGGGSPWSSPGRYMPSRSSEIAAGSVARRRGGVRFLIVRIGGRVRGDRRSPARVVHMHAARGIFAERRRAPRSEVRR